MTERFIVLNQIRTPDGTVLRSLHRHDYRTYVDANGKEYMVDGGTEYLRRNIHEDAPFEEISIYMDDTHEVIRQNLHWGTYGKNGDQPKRYVPLCNLSNDHIRAILDTQQQVQGQLRITFELELSGRENGTYPNIEDTL
jgi:hypothetical protein